MKKTALFVLTFAIFGCEQSDNVSTARPDAAIPYAGAGGNTVPIPTSTGTGTGTQSTATSVSTGTATDVYPDLKDIGETKQATVTTPGTIAIQAMGGSSADSKIASCWVSIGGKDVPMAVKDNGTTWTTSWPTQGVTVSVGTYPAKITCRNFAGRESSTETFNFPVTAGSGTTSQTTSVNTGVYTGTGVSTSTGTGTQAIPCNVIGCSKQGIFVNGICFPHPECISAPAQGPGTTISGCIITNGQTCIPSGFSAQCGWQICNDSGIVTSGGSRIGIWGTCNVTTLCPTTGTGTGTGTGSATTDVTSPVVQAPSVAGIFPGSKLTSGFNYTVTSVVTDNVGVSSCQMMDNGFPAGNMAVANGVASVSWQPVGNSGMLVGTEAQHTLTVKCADQRGNVGQASASFTVAAINAVTATQTSTSTGTDISLPTIQTIVANSIVSGTRGQISVIVSDNVGVTSCNVGINGQLFQATLASAVGVTSTWITPWDAPIVNVQTSYPISASCRDAAGNIGVPSVVYNIMVTVATATSTVTSTSTGTATDGPVITLFQLASPVIALPGQSITVSVDQVVTAVIAVTDSRSTITSCQVVNDIGTLNVDMQVVNGGNGVYQGSWQVKAPATGTSNVTSLQAKCLDGSNKTGYSSGTVTMIVNVPASTGTGTGTGTSALCSTTGSFQCLATGCSGGAHYVCQGTTLVQGCMCDAPLTNRPQVSTPPATAAAALDCQVVNGMAYITFYPVSGMGLLTSDQTGGLMSNNDVLSTTAVPYEVCLNGTGIGNNRAYCSTATWGQFAIYQIPAVDVTAVNNLGKPFNLEGVTSMLVPGTNNPLSLWIQTRFVSTGKLALTGKCALAPAGGFYVTQ